MTGPTIPVGEDDLAAHVDGRLPPDRLDLVRECLARDPDLARRVERDRAIRRDLRDGLLRADDPVPTRLRVSAVRARLSAARRRRATTALAASVVLGCGLGGGWWARGAIGPALPAGPGLSAGRWSEMAGEALAAHRTFAVEIVHPVEVKADQEAHLVQWLSRRLGHRLVIPDLGELGLTLVGGRLLPAGPDVAAFIMYVDATGRRLTLYVKSGEPGEERALRFMGEGPLASYAWSAAGCGFVVSAPFDPDALKAVARTVVRDLDMDTARRQPSL